MGSEKMAQFISRLLTKFKRDERGVFSLFVVMIFTTMILMGGAGVDLARVEIVRSSLQNSLDNAVLAAASLRQTHDPSVVVNDYMSNVETLSSFNVSIDAANTSVALTGRKVSATVTASVDTYFLRIAGLDTWDVSASSQASEAIPHLEVSLVLDASLSMKGGQMNSLKSSANTFVDTVFAGDAAQRTSISIVPYSTNVSVPQSMWETYATENIHINSRCMIFPDADYDETAIDKGHPQRQLPYYSDRGTFDSGLDYSACNTAAWSEIMPLSTSVEALHAKINSLQVDDVGGDNTAGHIGAKWGVALLDPAAAHLNTSGAVSPKLYTEPDILKVMVLMTDGQNTDHFDLPDKYRSGLSDMWAVYPDTSSNYTEYVYKALEPVGLFYERNGDSLDADGIENLPSGKKTQYYWPEVWEKMSTEGYGRMIEDNSLDINTVYSTRIQADNQMIRSCDAAKDKKVRIYTISFKVTPSESKKIFEECASDPKFYFDVSELDIESAFDTIALSIQKLKLSQ